MTRRLLGLALAVLLAGAAPAAAVAPAPGRLVLRGEPPVVAQPGGMFTAAASRLVLGGAEWSLDTPVGASDVVRLADVGGGHTVDVACGVSAEQVGLLGHAGRPLLVVVAPGGSCSLAGVTLGLAPPVPSGGRSASEAADGSPASDAALLVLDPTHPDGPRLRSARAAPGAAPVVTLHPGGRWAYVPAQDLTARRGHLQVWDLGDPDKLRVGVEVPLATGLTSTSLAVDADGAHLFAAAGTHTLVLDLADPAQPAIVGRIADYMVRNHTQVSVSEVVDDFWGRRRFLTVVARLGGGTGCATGAVHLYDITGDLLERPIMVAESAVPEAEDHPQVHPDQPDGCPTAHATLEPTAFRARIDWTVADHVRLRRDWFAYDITPMFQARAQYCTLVRA